MRENNKKSSMLSGEFFCECALFILDYLLFLIVIPVCGVAFWVGTYYFLLYLNNPQPWFAEIKYFLITFCAIVFVVKHVARIPIYKFIRDRIHSEVKFFIISKIYIYIFSLCSTIVFAGIFEAKFSDNLPVVKSDNKTNVTNTSTEIQIENNPLLCILLTIFGFLILLCIKGRPHLVGGAGDVGKENTAEDVFLFPVTLFATTWKKNKFLYILDSIFSVFIVGTLVILVWRGAWCLLDQTIFPGESTYLLSGWISLGIGYSVVFATFALQRFMKMLIRMYHGWKRLLIIDTYVVVSFCGTINIWRGIWILLEEFANLENSLINCVILHFLSFFILVIFNSSNTLLVRGVYIDAEENGEDCIEFPCYYFRLRFQERQKEKTLVELNMVSKTHNIEEKRDATFNEQNKKPEAEIITEINPQQIPLILNNSHNSNGDVAPKIEQTSNS